MFTSAAVKLAKDGKKRLILWPSPILHPRPCHNAFSLPNISFLLGVRVSAGGTVVLFGSEEQVGVSKAAGDV